MSGRAVACLEVRSYLAHGSESGGPANRLGLGSVIGLGKDEVTRTG